MTDDEVRQIVRQAIGRHLRGQAAAPIADAPPPPVAVPLAFHRYHLPRPPGDEMCIVEPEVRCNHCGYCQCHSY